MFELHRRNRLQQIFSEKYKDVDGILVAKLENIRWLTGFTGSFGMVLFTNDGICSLITDGRYANPAQGLCEKQGIKFVLFDDAFCEGFVKKIRGKFLLESTVSLGRFEKLKKLFSNIDFQVESDVIESLRSQKDTEEIRLTKVAAAHVDKILMDFPRKILRSGVTERAAAYALKNMIESEGEFELAFDPIVAFGENSAIPHHIPGERKLKSAENVLVDCGAKFQGYCSDITRNFWFGVCDGYFQKYNAYYDILLDIQKKAAEKCVVGQNRKELAEFVRSELGDLDQYFTHSLGHGTGLEIHEQPSVSRKSEGVFQENEIVTCEPGIYFPGEFGIRIEDQIIVVDEFSAENFCTNFGRELGTI